jgi:4-amino-4-deoxy-L-arabinose transferase-like glycosyltransferase
MEEQKVSNRPDWRGAAVVAGLYLAVAILYGVAIPVFETPDASGHYAYVHELTEGRGLPVQGTPSGERVTGYVASHPPLYYALCATFTFWVPDDVDFDDWAWRNPYHANGFPGSVGNKNFLVHTDEEAFPWRGTPLTMHIARLVSALLGVLVVLGTYGTAWEVVSARGSSRRACSYMAVGAAALTAFNPMFVFTGARVSNDAAVAAFGSLVIWGATRLAVRRLSRRGLALLGVALGLAVLSKLSGVTLAPAVVLAFLLDGARNAARDTPLKKQIARLLVDAGVTFGAAILVCGWWFVRNLLLYGELMGVDAWLSHTATVRPEAIGFFDVVPQLRGLEMSYWAMFGWFNVPVAPWMYRAWWVLVRLAVLGLLILLVEQFTRRRMRREARAGLAIVAFSFLLVFASVWRFIMIVLGAQGRYLFTAIAAASTSLMLGVARLVGRRGEGSLAILLAVVHLAAASLVLFLFILPAYARPGVVAEPALPDDLARLELTAEGTPIQLLGGQIEVEEARPGERVPVSLYWRAVDSPTVDYVAHVRLLGRALEPVSATDCYPGGGTFPTTLWEPGLIYRDLYLLPVGEQAEVPALLVLEAGLRVRGDAPLPLIQPSGEPWPGMALLDVVPLRPPRQPSLQVAYPIAARVGESITLVGADLSDTRAAAGDAVTVTLVWQAEAVVPADYTAFVHLMDERGELVAQADAPPLGGDYPTSWWVPGDVIRGPHRLSLPVTLPPGLYTLQVGLYDPAAGTRVPATDAVGNRFAEEAIPVTTLEIR